MKYKATLILELNADSIEDLIRQIADDIEDISFRWNIEDENGNKEKVLI